MYLEINAFASLYGKSKPIIAGHAVEETCKYTREILRCGDID